MFFFYFRCVYKFILIKNKLVLDLKNFLAEKLVLLNFKLIRKIFFSCSHFYGYN